MIEVNNLAGVSVNKIFLKKIAEKILEKEREKNTELSIVLIRQSRIRELNKKYRRKDKVTDVLSFSYDHSGEIVICPKEVRRNAKKFGSNYKKELARVLIHGILHLLGQDHEKSKKKAEKMRKKEEYYLLQLKF